MRDKFLKKKIWVVLCIAVLICVVSFALLHIFPFCEETSSSQSPNPITTQSPNPITKQSPSPISLQPQSPVITASSSLFEKLIEIRIFNNGTVKSYRERYYQLYKEIEIRRGSISIEEVEELLELSSKLADHGEYIYKVSDEFMKEGHILEPLGNMEVSWLPLNKTSKISFRPSNFPEQETITPEAKQILAIIDKAYLEAEVVEIIKEANS